MISIKNIVVFLFFCVLSSCTNVNLNTNKDLNKINNNTAIKNDNSKRNQESSVELKHKESSSISVDLLTKSSIPLNEIKYFENNIYSPFPTNASYVIKSVFHPQKTTELNKPSLIKLGVPFPRGFLINKDDIVLSYAGKELPLASAVINYWPALKDNIRYIRSVQIVTEFQFIDYKPVDIDIIINKRNKTFFVNSYNDDQFYVSIKQQDNPNEYGNINIMEPKVYVTFPSNWLSACFIRGRTLPMYTNDAYSWFDTAYINFGKTMVNEVGDYVKQENKINYIAESEPWLFDRAFTLWGLYIRTGDIKWLRHAFRATQFYSSKINDQGYFTLKNYDDLKFSYGLSIITDMMLTANIRNNSKINYLIRAAEKWNPNYADQRRHWTERHQAYAFMIWLSAWEITGDNKYLEILNKYINAIRSHQVNPPYGWIRDGGLLHTEASHEGDDNLDPVASPWMTALLAEGIYRFAYLSENNLAYEILSDFGDWIQKYALYDGVVEHPELSGIIVPRYLFSSTYNSDEAGAWDDLEHACDVAGLLTKSQYSKVRLNLPYTDLNKSVNSLMKTCKYALKRWFREGSDKQNGLPEWRLNPPRKFNWWFGSTNDMPWFLLNINQ